jgi:hypothetical protein
MDMEMDMDMDMKVRVRVNEWWCNLARRETEREEEKTSLGRSDGPRLSVVVNFVTDLLCTCRVHSTVTVAVWRTSQSGLGRDRSAPKLSYTPSDGYIIGWTSPLSSSYWRAILAAVLDSLIAQRQLVSDCWRYVALIGRVCCLLPVRVAGYNPASKRSQHYHHMKDTRCMQS